MKRIFTRVIPIFTSIFLTACSMNLNQNIDSIENGTIGKKIPVTDGAPVGGNIAKAMDENDRWKLSRALDSAPGKPTHWVNMGTGMSYTVEPTKKISINGNPFCRKYNLTATHNNITQQIEGSACVGADGEWKSI